MGRNGDIDSFRKEDHLALHVLILAGNGDERY